MQNELNDRISKPSQILTKRFLTIFVFSIAFAYIESAVVVYLRAIFHSEGFSFPLTEFGTSPLWEKFFLIEVGRELATLVLILTGCWLFGRNSRRRFAYFLTIFAVWDIFYYIWLKLFLDWPASIMDWDILFLIPVVWASPVLAPVLASLTMLVFAVTILYLDSQSKHIRVTLAEWFGFSAAIFMIIVSFCIAGLHITEQDYQSYFSWSLFAIGETTAILLFGKCLIKSKQLVSSGS